MKEPADASPICGWSFKPATDNNKMLTMTCQSSLSAEEIAQKVQAATEACAAN